MRMSGRDAGLGGTDEELRFGCPECSGGFEPARWAVRVQSWEQAELLGTDSGTTPGIRPLPSVVLSPPGAACRGQKAAAETMALEFCTGQNHPSSLINADPIPDQSLRFTALHL